MQPLHQPLHQPVQALFFNSNRTPKFKKQIKKHSFEGRKWHRFYSGSDIINFVFDALPDFKFYDFSFKSVPACVLVRRQYLVCLNIGNWLTWSSLDRFSQNFWAASYIVIEVLGRRFVDLTAYSRQAKSYLDRRLKTGLYRRARWCWTSLKSKFLTSVNSSKLDRSVSDHV